MKKLRMIYVIGVVCLIGGIYFAILKYSSWNQQSERDKKIEQIAEVYPEIAELHYFPIDEQLLVSISASISKVEGFALHNTSVLDTVFVYDNFQSLVYQYEKTDENGKIEMMAGKIDKEEESFIQEVRTPSQNLTIAFLDGVFYYVNRNKNVYAYEKANADFPAYLQRAFDLSFQEYCLLISETDGIQETHSGSDDNKERNMLTGTITSEHSRLLDGNFEFVVQKDTGLLERFCVYDSAGQIKLLIDAKELIINPQFKSEDFVLDLSGFQKVPFTDAT